VAFGYSFACEIMKTKDKKLSGSKICPIHGRVNIFTMTRKCVYC
jgi:hypothetical protein